MLALVDKGLTPRPKVVRFGVAHVEAPDVAERIRTALIAAFGRRDCFVSLATGVLGPTWPGRLGDLLADGRRHPDRATGGRSW